MRLILSIEDGDDVAARYLQTQVEAMRLTDGVVVIDEQLHVGVAQLIDFGLGFSDGAGIIFTTDGDDLHEFFRVVEIIDFLDGFAIHILFIFGRQKDSEGETGIAVHRRGVIEPRMLRFFPDEEAQSDIEDGLKDHQ